MFKKVLDGYMDPCMDICYVYIYATYFSTYVSYMISTYISDKLNGSLIGDADWSRMKTPAICNDAVAWYDLMGTDFTCQ